MSEKRIYSNQEVMAKFVEADSKHKNAIETFIKKYKMQQSQHKLLMTMVRMNEGNQVSQREISRELKVTPAAIAVNLKKLAGFGMIEKIMSEKDNRFNFVKFTEKGNKTIKESQEKFQYFDDLAMEGFTDEEKETLYHFMERISDNLNKADI